MSGVYIVGSQAHSYLKIGIAKDVKRRIRQLQTVSPTKLDVIHVENVPLEDIRIVEKAAHKALLNCRMSGEWFDCSPETAKSAVVEAAFSCRKPTQNGLPDGSFETSPCGMRSARIFLGWSVAELAQRAGVAASTAMRFEASEGRTIPSIVSAMQRAMEDGGVIFLPAGETAPGGPGVRLR